MIPARQKTDINQSEDREMVAFIVIVGLIVDVAKMSFQHLSAEYDVDEEVQ